MRCYDPKGQEQHVQALHESGKGAHMLAATYKCAHLQEEGNSLLGVFAP